MATLKAPLLSMSASGNFANVFQYSRWKRLMTARTQPRTTVAPSAAQILQREKMALCLAFWSYWNIRTGITEEWARYARIKRQPKTPMNSFLSSALPLLIEPGPVMFTINNATWQPHYWFLECRNLLTTAPNYESGQYFIEWGFSERQLSTKVNMETAWGGCHLENPPTVFDVGTVIFLKLSIEKENGVATARSGILRIVVEEE